ncbi:ABC transporter family substrate-binding protein [Actinacidiphila oryziradicis]|uniref:ABC transporter family substrate-binding protein n=1 Tax=Actinacidiphila oryziradicis TaxID=2571141 RepID=A0A4U0SH15_9ACTN|nr:ABC transporter family substrate-binding protein [Actinacidiphila oryziradicis]TKA08940.1 ABC transporter family substrate-binding protein [Actinacidiphila oryziradicis]
MMSSSVRMVRPVPCGRAAAVAGLAAVLVLAGCSSGTAEDPAAGTDVAAYPRAAVRDGGKLRWAVDALPSTLNAFQPGADGTTRLVTGAALPALFRLDGRGRPQRDEDYLASADVVATEPKQVVAYKLNPEARWSDGRAIDAADFAAQWKALRGRDSAYWTARNAGYDRITDIQQGADAREVRVTFAKPYADWRALFTPLYPRAVTARADAFNDAARTGLPAAAGPFAVRAVDPRAGTVTLVRNKRWWGAPAKLDQIVLTAVDRGERPAAIAAGKLDVAEIDPSDYTAAHRDRNLSLHKAPGASYSQLALNGSSGPLADERVRHAVARAIDRRALATAALKPLGLPYEPLGNHFLLASQDGYADHSSALGTADVKSARALLAAAAGTAGGPAPADDKQLKRKEWQTPLTLRLVLPRSSPALDRAGDRIARDLAAIGIRTRVLRVADDSFFRDHVASGDFDLALYSWPGTAYPATDARPIFAKPLPAPDGSLTVEQNYTRVGTDQIDLLLDQAATELDPANARRLTARADARIWAAAASIPLFQRPELVALAPSVANAGAFGLATPRYQDIGFRKAVTAPKR